MEIQNWLKLRIAVIQLDEKNQWWDTHVLESDSEAFLGYVLPKTKRKAAFKLATEIACLHHDRNIKASHYHLFRLPSILEKQIHHLDIFDSDVPDPLLLLSTLSGAIAVSEKEGPVNVGSVTELEDPVLLESIAKHYLEAFKGNYKTFPYLI